MSESHELGRKGEDLAGSHLRDKGFSILFRNWRWGGHEIDIIAENKDYIVFVEVKTRSENFIVSPGDAVPRSKQKAIIIAADGYIQSYKIDKESRFDIITIVRKNKDFEIDHIENAFYPTLR